MKFLHLKMYNFGPYRGEQSLTFPSDASRPVMVVFGDNMRGKSSLLNAMRWILYGSALDRHSRRMDLLKLVNFDAAREGDWKMWVQLQFEAEGDEYDLRRIVEPQDLLSTPRSERDFRP